MRTCQRSSRVNGWSGLWRFTVVGPATTFPLDESADEAHSQLMTSTEMTAAEYKAHINGPDYRPENVRIVQAPDPYAYRADGWCVLDFDGRRITWHATRTEAVAHQKD